jgi:hypothetical protein
MGAASLSFVTLVGTFDQVALPQNKIALSRGTSISEDICDFFQENQIPGTEASLSAGRELFDSK